MKLAILALSALLAVSASSPDRIIKCQFNDVTADFIEAIPIDPFNPNHCQNVVLAHNQLSEIPRKVFGIFPNLERFEANNGTLEVIRSDTFGSSLLRSIYVTNNLVSSVEANAFSGASNLNHLDLSYNRISSLSNDAFRGLVNLRELRLISNGLTSLNAALFRDLTNLVVFSAQLNRLSTVDAATFADLPHIRVLSLADNRLTNLDLRFNHADVNFVSVASNQLRGLRIAAANVLPPGWVPSGLRVLAFRNNLRQIDIETSLNLVELVVSHNNLTDLTGVSPHSGLQTLRADDNQLTLHVGALDNLLRLEQLDLSLNHIHRIVGGTFKNQARLQVLKLSQNPIHVLDFGNLTGLSALERLEIDNTQILRFKLFGVRENLPKLEKIEITRSHWNCTFLQAVVDAFKVYNIAVTASSDIDATVDDLEFVNGIQCIPDGQQRYSDDDIKGIIVNGTLQTDDDYPFEDYDYTFEEKDYFLNLQMLPSGSEGPSARRSWVVGITAVLTVACVGLYFVMQKRNAFLRINGSDNVNANTRLL